MESRTPKLLSKSIRKPKPTDLTISRLHSGSTLTLSHLTVQGHKGYSTCLLNHPICEGSFYFEVRIEKSSKGQPFRKWVQPHVRVGVASRMQEKEVVLGFDANGYAFGDTGNVYHEGIKTPYGCQYNIDDIIGV
jgi:hypothetical protein